MLFHLAVPRLKNGIIITEGAGVRSLSRRVRTRAAISWFPNWYTYSTNYHHMPGIFQPNVGWKDESNCSSGNQRYIFETSYQVLTSIDAIKLTHVAHCSLFTILCCSLLYVCMSACMLSVNTMN